MHPAYGLLSQARSILSQEDTGVSTTLSRRQWEDLALRAGEVFTPTAPINERNLFAGREDQVRQVIDAVNQTGKHAIIFGERGVGKTSLANVLSAFLGYTGSKILAPRVTCVGQDNFDSVWRKVLQKVEIKYEAMGAGFAPSSAETVVPAAQMLLVDEKEKITTDAVRRALLILAQDSTPILIIDEFDALADRPRRAFADLIKTLSDDAVEATIVLVGVADSVGQLIKDHKSVERALAQVPMPRMSNEEIEAIINTGLGILGMSIEIAPLRRIVVLSQGLPHYTHVFGLYAARQAIDSGSLVITDDVVGEAINKAIAGTQQTIRTAYHQAIMSPRKDNLFAVVLLSCALAKTDELGYFAAQDVRAPMQIITKNQKYNISTFAQHLKEFCEDRRGPILQRIGTRRRYRFRFVNPLMQPFVIMRGFNSGLLNKEVLDRIEAAQV